MNTPYIPSDGLSRKLQRRLTRLKARKPLNCAGAHRLVSFTFDDFTRTAAAIGARTLEQHGWRGTFYASASFEDAYNHLGDLFTVQDIAKLVAQGHEIGCHTENHIDCALNPPVVVADEARRNRNHLTRLGAPNPTSFAFPYGEVSAATKKLLGQYYTTLRGVRPGINRRLADAHQLSAIAIEGDMDALPGILAVLDDLQKKPGWLIFYTHDVRDHPSEWGCTPALFGAVCAAVKAHNFEVRTVQDAHTIISSCEAAA